MKCFYIDDSITKCNDFDIRYIEYGCNEQEHTHDGIEITYITEGNGEHIIDGNTIRVKRGSLVVTEIGTVHSINVWKTMKYYNVLFKASFLNMMLDKDINLQSLLRQHYDYDFQKKFLYINFEDEKSIQNIEEIFLKILKEAINKEARYKSFCRCYIDEVFNAVLRKEQDENLFEWKDMMDEVMQYISDNSNRPLLLDDVAKKFGYNSRYLSSKIKKSFGISFKQFLIECRLNNAVEELLKNDESIERVAEKCGFTNKSYFYELFTKTYGINPKVVKGYCKQYPETLDVKVNRIKSEK